jgi:hypothetical protein
MRTKCNAVSLICRGASYETIDEPENTLYMSTDRMEMGGSANARC